MVIQQASELFSWRVCEQLFDIFGIHPTKIDVMDGSQPHLYFEKKLLGYMDGYMLFVNNPDYDSKREGKEYPKHGQWHPVFYLLKEKIASCACRGPECVPNPWTWEPPILERRASQ